jgi:hypothetical protein
MQRLNLTPDAEALVNAIMETGTTEEVVLPPGGKVSFNGMDLGELVSPVIMTRPCLKGCIEDGQQVACE